MVYNVSVCDLHGSRLMMSVQCVLLSYYMHEYLYGDRGCSDDGLMDIGVDS